MVKRVIVGMFQTNKGEIAEERVEAEYDPDKVFQIYSSIIHQFNLNRAKKRGFRANYVERIPISARWENE